MTTRNIVKQWFQKYMKPTQAQFSTLFDSIWFKNEQIPSTKIEGLSSLLDGKADDELLKVHTRDTNNHTSTQEKEIWNKKLDTFNLSNSPTYLNYDYFSKKVYGVLLPIPPRNENKYNFLHGLNIEKYLRLEVWENGLPPINPKMKAREDLTSLIYKVEGSEIGFSAIGSTPIGGTTNGSLSLTSNAIKIVSEYAFPNNKLLYIEYTTVKEGIGEDKIGTTKIK